MHYYVVVLCCIICLKFKSFFSFGSYLTENTCCHIIRLTCNCYFDLSALTTKVWFTHNNSIINMDIEINCTCQVLVYCKLLQRGNEFSGSISGGELIVSLSWMRFSRKICSKEFETLTLPNWPIKLFSYFHI